MEWLQIVSLVVSVLSLSTVSSLVWKDLHDKKVANSQHVKELKQKESAEQIRNIIAEEVKPICDKMDYINDRLEKIGNGTLSTLRNDILRCYYDCLGKGYRNDYDYENLHDLYDSYDELNGNSFVSDIMARFDALPTKEQFLKQKGGTEGSGK